jgi:hypothetical protein
MTRPSICANDPSKPLATEAHPNPSLPETVDENPMKGRNICWTIYMLFHITYFCVKQISFKMTHLTSWWLQSINHHPVDPQNWLTDRLSRILSPSRAKGHLWSAWMIHHLSLTRHQSRTKRSRLTESWRIQWWHLFMNQALLQLSLLNLQGELQWLFLQPYY